MIREEKESWWAMSAVYNRSMKMKNLLDAEAIENFVPMQSIVQLVGRRKVRKSVPAIRNLIFIHTTGERIKLLKSKYPFLQYLTLKSDGQVHPIVVPEEQMSHFIAIAGSDDERLIYLNADQCDLRAGDKVRIHGGIFDGVEGVFLKLRGVRDRRVVVAIEGVVAIATAIVHPDLLEKI